MSKKVAKKAVKKAPAKTTGKELAVVKNDYQVANTSMFEGMGLGAGEQIDSADILIPKLQLTQALSKCVASNKVRQGTYVNSVSLADLGESNDMIIMDSYKNWQVFEAQDKGQDKYIETIPFYGNETLKFHDVVEGKNIVRIQVLGFYVILLEEIKAGMAFPYAVDFKKGSKQAGRQLASDFAKLRSINLPSFAKVYTVGTELVQEEYTYHRKTVSMGRDITGEELAAVKGWLETLSSRKDNITVDDSDAKEAEGTVTVENADGTTVDGVKF